MNIGLIVHPYGEEKPSGLGRAIFEMAKALVAVDTQNSYTFYFKETPKALPEAISSRVKSVVLHTKHLLVSAGVLKRTAEDVFVFFTPIIPLTFFPRKSIVVVHDLGFLMLPKRTLREWILASVLYMTYAISLGKATRIITVSEATKETVRKYFKIPEQKIVVIYNGLTPLPKSIQPSKTPEKFFLFVGALKERKNVRRVIEAFIPFSKTSPDYHLILVGKTEGAYATELKRIAEASGMGDRIHFRGYVSDEELASLYAHARAFVFPSLVEGFGMSILEAMEAGTPVITSHTGALAEIAGDAALLVNPMDTLSIQDAVETLATNDTLYTSLQAQGRKRANSFSWNETGMRFLRVIDSIAETPTHMT